MVEIGEGEQCCGFGGTFSVAFPHVSRGMGTLKLEHVLATAPDVAGLGRLELPHAPRRAGRPGRGDRCARCTSRRCCATRFARAARPGRESRGAGRSLRRRPERIAPERGAPGEQGRAREAHRGAVPRLRRSRSLRRLAGEIKQHTLDHLDLYLERAEARLEANGAQSPLRGRRRGGLPDRARHPARRGAKRVVKTKTHGQRGDRARRVPRAQRRRVRWRPISASSSCSSTPTSRATSSSRSSTRTAARWRAPSRGTASAPTTTRPR